MEPKPTLYTFTFKRLHRGFLLYGPDHKPVLEHCYRFDWLAKTPQDSSFASDSNCNSVGFSFLLSQIGK